MSEQGTALTTRSSMLPSPDDWQMLRALAESLVKSGFLPKAINTPEKAIAVMEKGRELNIKPMYALSNIAVIDGKPMAGAELMLALIYRDHGDDALRVIESTPERCTAIYRRRGWSEGEQFSFTMDDAKRAGLTGKDNWRNYPAAMLRARCISAIARLAFPDTIGGLYTLDELGAEESIDDAGDVVIVQQVAPETRTVEASPYKPASANQLATIAQLSRLLGYPDEDCSQMTSAESSERIKTLSREYQERKGAAHVATEQVQTSQPPAEPHPLAPVLGERVQALIQTTGETKEGIMSRMCDLEGLRRGGRIDFSTFGDDEYQRLITRVEREIDSAQAEKSELAAYVPEDLPF